MLSRQTTIIMQLADIPWLGASCKEDIKHRRQGDHANPGNPRLQFQSSNYDAVATFCMNSKVAPQH